jgi:Skp family chaperone for outer membrane proteins
MNNRFVYAALAASLLAMPACSKPPSGDIGLVDVARVTSNWPKFLNYQNQLNADVAAIRGSRASDNDKNRQLAGLQARFATNQTELTNNVRDAAQQVANDKHLHYVLTRQFIGYGGVDITPDVEKILNITERATPAP